MKNKSLFLAHLSLFMSGAMFWGAIIHVFLAVKGFETEIFGIEVSETEN